MTALTERLREFEAALLAIGMPGADVLGPGSAPEDTARFLGDNGWPVNQELIDWFSWHNGTRGPDHEVSLHDLCPTGYRPLGFDEALAEARLDREVIEQTFAGDDDPPYGWDDRWLPLGVAGHGGVLVAEVDPADTERVRLLQLEWDRSESFDRVRSRSLLEAVECWLDLVREHCRWVSPPAMWELDYAAIGYGTRLPGVL